MSCCCKKFKRSGDAKNDDGNSPVKLIKDRDEMTELLKSPENQGKLVVVDFFAVWCGPCKASTPKVRELAEEFKGRVTFYKVDVDESEELATSYSISSMPTFILFKDSKKIDESFGSDIGKLKEMIIKYK